MSVPMGTRVLYIVARSGLGEPALSAAALASAAFLAALDEEEAPVSVTKTSMQRSIAPAGAPSSMESGKSEKLSTSLGVLVGRRRIGDAQCGEGGGEWVHDVVRQRGGLVGVGEEPRLNHAPSQDLELPHSGRQLSWWAHGRCQGMAKERRRLEGAGGLRRRG